MDFTRPLQPGEEDAVHSLLCAAFDTDAEAQLVRKLRKARLIAGEMVMPVQGQIAGYYALSAMTKPKGWLALAPVAIHPDLQRQRLGKRMIGMLSEWARLTKTPVVVLGEPAFYESAGFDRAAAAHLTSPYPISHTMLAGVSGAPKTTLQYPDPFNAL
jgi:putative acetyltransferase